MYWRRRLTRLELAIYVGVVAIVVLAFLERALYYMELAERVAMNATVTNVNSSLAVRSAYEMLGGRRERLDPNPFAGLTRPPQNYLGAFAAPDLDAAARGSWLYDSARREVVYLPRLHRGLIIPEAGLGIRFRVEAADRVYKLVPTTAILWE